MQPRFFRRNFIYGYTEIVLFIAVLADSAARVQWMVGGNRSPLEAGLHGSDFIIYAP